MSKKNRIGLYMFVGMCFGILAGYINTIASEKRNMEADSDFKAISHDIRKTLSRDNGCTSALSTALISQFRKTTEKSFSIDGFTLSSGKQLILGSKDNGYNLKVEELSLNELNSIGKNKEGYQVYTAKLDATFVSNRLLGKKTARTLSSVLLTLDNRDRLVKCSNRFSGDAIAMMTSLCAGSHQVYSRDTGHCHSPRAMARQKRGLSSVK